jgi:hypothetical protein
LGIASEWTVKNIPATRLAELWICNVLDVGARGLVQGLVLVDSCPCREIGPSLLRPSNDECGIERDR